MSLGSLRVLLGLDAAEFTRGLTKAEQEAQKFQRGMVNVGKTIGTALGATLSAGTFIAMVKGAIDASDRLNDLSKQTGVAVETLGGLGFAATQAGGDLDSTVQALGKLNKTIAEADAGNEKSLEFFQKLGISVRESSGEIKDAGAVYLEVADKFTSFADGPQKAALALRGFGKTGQEQIPILNEGAEALRKNIDYYRQFSGVTAESARQADEFNDTMGRLGLLARSLGQKIAIDLLPLLQTLGNEFQKTGEDGQTAFDSIAKGFSNFFRNISIAGIQIKYVISTVIKDISDFDAYMQQFFSRNADAARAIRERAANRAQSDREEVDRLTREIANAVPQKPIAGVGLENLNAALRQPNRRPPAPGLRDSGAASNAAQEQRKLLDKHLSDLENFSKAEQRLLESRNNSLDRLYEQDQLSIADYFAGKAAALDRATFEQADIYNEQIALLEKFYNETKEQTAKLDALKEIGRFKEKRSELLADRSNQATKDFDDSARAAGEYAGQVAEVQARVLELQGTEEAAARAALIRFDLQNRALLNRARIEGDSGTQSAVGQLRAQVGAQAEINALLSKAAVIEQNLATAQAKLHLERDLGMRDEIDSYKALANSSTDAAAKLQVIADKYLAIARADGSAVLIANAEAFKQKVTELAAATDILAAKFRQTFVDTGASAIETFLNNLADGKNALDSFKEAFTQFATDIIRQINRIAAQKIADSLFKSGSGGSDGGIFSSVADAFVQYIGGLGGREKGGPVAGRTAYVVGERGPEIFVPQTAAVQASKQIDSLIAQRGKPAEYSGKKVAAIAANLPHMIGAKGPEIFVPKTAGIVIPHDKVTKLATVLEKKARPQFATVLEKTVSQQSNLILDKRNSTSRRETILRDRRETILRDEKIIKRYANAPSQREKYLQQSARAIARNQRAVADLVADAPRQRRAAGGRVTAATPYLVGELGPELFVPKQAGQVIKNAKAIDALIFNTTQRKNVNQFNNTNEVQRKSISLFTDTNETQRKNVENTNENNLTKTINKAVNINKAIIANNSIKATNNNAINNINKAVNTSAAISSKAIKAINNSVISNQTIRNQAIHTKAINNNRAVNKAIYSNEAVTINKAINESTNNAINNKAINSINEAINNKVINNAAISNREISNQVTKAINNSSISNQEISNRAISNNATNSAVTNNKAINAAISNKAINSAISNQTISKQAINNSAVNSINKAIHNNEAVNRVVNESANSAISNQAISNRAIDNSAIRNINKAVHEAIITKAINNKSTNSAVTNNAINNAINNKSVNNKGTIDRLISNIERTTNNVERTTNQSKLLVTNAGSIGTAQALNNIIINARPALNQSGALLAMPSEKIISNNRKISELISRQQTDKTVINNLKKVDTNNSKISELLIRQQNEKAVINNLRNVEKTTAELWKPIVGSASTITVPTEKTNSKISQLISDQRTAKTVINNLKSAEKTTELLRPATSKIISNELSEFVSNIQNNQTTNESVQRRANGGPVAAYQTYMVGERGAEIFVPKDISVPSDFFTSDVYRRAWGGTVNANRPYIVGERGPELFVPKTAGQIVTNNNRNAGDNKINISFVLPPGEVTRTTQNQIAAAAARGLAIASRRMN